MNSGRRIGVWALAGLLILGGGCSQQRMDDGDPQTAGGSVYDQMADEDAAALEERLEAQQAKEAAPPRGPTTPRRSRGRDRPHGGGVPR